MPKTMTVTVLLGCAHGWPVTHECVISACCPFCGGPRGVPELTLVTCAGHSCCVDHWDNPCGHVDTDAHILMEINLQCSHTGCINTWTPEHYPFCSLDCAGVELVGRAKGGCHGLR